MSQPAPTLRASNGDTDAGATGSRRVTRAEIVALAPRAWQFLGPALAALRVAPQDHEIRVHAVLALARLGLVTLARELAATVAPEIRGLAQVAPLLRAIPETSDDVIDAETLARVARANLGAILSRPERVYGATPEELERAFEAWTATVGEREWYRASNGCVVRRVRGSWAPEQWWGLADTRGAAEAFAAQHLRVSAASGQDAMTGPYTVEGVDPPWILERVLAATQDDVGVAGYRPRVGVVQREAGEFLDGLAQADLSALLGAARVEFFVGEGAGASFSARVSSMVDTINTGPCIVTSGIRTRAVPRADETIEGARAARQGEIRAGAERAAAMYAGRDAAWWADRYRAALSGAGEPLRVLIPTCLYSTFVRHASDDLARAIRRAGMDARVLIEPDHSSRLSASGYLRAIEAHRPDLIVLINYTRGQISPHIPRNIPWLTWIQDAMPHLLSPEIGPSLGGFDFLVGHIFSELVQKFGVARERCLAMPVVADAEKFHAGPVGRGDAAEGGEARLRCDVAYVSHQSETPDALHERLIRAGAVAPAYLPALERIRARVAEIVSVGLFEPGVSRGMQGRIKDAVAAALADAGGGEPDAKTLAAVVRVHALPLAERTMRHRTLESAARICARRGWTMRLFGNGWASHPTLSGLASGALEHGEDLRASYRAARCHLHVSLTAPVHQRVMECALSGGLPLVRLHADGLSATHLRACRSAARARAPHRLDHEEGWIGWDAIDHPALAAWVALRQRLGMPTTDAVYFRPHWMENLELMDLLLPRELDPANLLVDPAETAFWDDASLERVIERAVTDEGWRATRSAAIASRVRRSMTHDAMVTCVTRFILDRLDAGAAAAPGAAPRAAA